MAVYMKDTYIHSIKAVRMGNEELEVVILPRLGGKTASFFHKAGQFELAAQPDRVPYKIPEKDTPFSDCDASGLDDAFPTILEGHLGGSAEAYRYTDHGEIWRSAFSVRKNEERLEMVYKSTENPYLYRKSLSLRGNTARYTYVIENTGTADFPCMWTMHGLVRYEPDMELLYPGGVKRFLNVADSPELGEAGIVYPAKGGTYDFHHVPPADSLTQIKYYVLGQVPDGWCGYRYPAQGMECMIRYDVEKLPYLGMWITAGGFRGEHNCAWEPSNGFYDGVETASENGALPVLKGGARLEFTVDVELREV